MGTLNVQLPIHLYTFPHPHTHLSQTLEVSLMWFWLSKETKRFIGDLFVTVIVLGGLALLIFILVKADLLTGYIHT